MQDTSGFPGFSCAGVTTLTMGVGDGGVGQSSLASNKFMSVGSIVGHGVSSLILKIGAWGASSKGGGIREFSSG